MGPAVVDIRESPWSGFEGHEQVVTAQDAASGLRVVIAIHSTALGPALGGTRISAYGGNAFPGWAAQQDALRLSRAMTYKNALAGLDHGGGKAVILGDPQAKSIDLLHAYGRVVESLAGRYVTAGDLGMTVADMDVIGEACRWTTGRSPERGGVGDSGILTAVGVWQGMRASADHLWGSPDLAGRHIGVVGAGKVGGRLIGHLAEEGAKVTVVEPSKEARDLLLATCPGVQVAGSLDELISGDIDILSPNATGAMITSDLVARLRVRLVCGGANNQLAAPEVADELAAAGILFAPDFMVNCGGVIQVAEELAGCDLIRARERVDRVYGTTERVLRRAVAEGMTPLRAAEAEAEDRIRAATG
jgi:valine dehydrogenase (NAD+)